MKIQKLSIFGFKGVRQNIIEPKMVNQISGRNESGKTSVKEAIVFALYGKINGSTHIDNVINKNQNQAKVILEFVATLDDTSYIIERTKTLKTNTIKLNGRIVGQSTINDLMLMDYELFSSAFCVGDFMKFEPKERRRILLELVRPKNSRLILWKKLTGEDKCDYDLSNLEASYKIVKEELDEVDSKIITSTNRKQFIAEEISQFQAAVAVGVKDQITSKEFEEMQAEHNKVMMNEPKLESYIAGTPEPIGNLQDSLALSEGELAATQQKKPSKITVDRLIVQMNLQKEKIEKLKNSAVCPTCKRPYDNTAIRVEQLKIENKKLVEIKAEGKENLEAYNADIKSFERQAEEKAEKVGVLRKQIAERQEANSSVITMGKEDWSIAHGKWVEDSDKANEIFQAIKNKFDLSERERIQKDNAITQLNKKETEFETENTKLKSFDRGKLQNYVNALGAKGISFEEIQDQIKEVQEFLPEDCKLELLEQNKTNDRVKAVFNLSCDGIPYAWLSTGKQLSVDIHLADVITSILEVNMIFVDNIELLTLKIVLKKEPVKQLFTAIVKDTDFSIVSN